MDKYCRTCMRDSNQFSPIYEEMTYAGIALQEAIEDICQLEVTIGDDLPVYICKDCTLKLYDIVKFKMKAQEVYCTLRTLTEKLLFPTTGNLWGSEDSVNHSSEEEEMPRLILEDSDTEEEIVERVPSELLADWGLLNVPEDEEEDSLLASSESILQGSMEECEKNRTTGSFVDKSNVQRKERENRRFHDFLVCDHCKKEFKDKTTLLKHLVVHSRQSLLSAKAKRTRNKISSKSENTNKRGSKVRKRKQLRKVQWRCKICGKECDNAGELRKHKKSHPKEQTFTCRYCSKTFSRKGVLKKHEFVHTGVKPHKCKYCPKTFSLKSTLKDHELVHTGIKSHACEYCFKKFSLKSSLRRHELLHTGVKPHACKYCSKTFSQRCHLNSHELIHTVDRPHECKYCLRKFTSEEILKEHELIHIGVRFHACKFCPKKFRQKCNLDRHELTHTGGRSHECQYCSKKFSRRTNLINHELTHTGVMPVFRPTIPDEADTSEEGEDTPEGEAVQ